MMDPGQLLGARMPGGRNNIVFEADQSAGDRIGTFTFN